MANHRQPRQFGLLATLSLLISATSALSLSNLQLISAPAVPIECMTAYSAELPGCDALRPGPEPRCPGRCRRALGRVQTVIQATCASVEAAPGTVLDDAKSGRLVETVCGAGPDRASPNDDSGAGSPPVVTVTVPPPQPDDTLITAPAPEPTTTVIQNKGKNEPIVLPSDSVTITTAIKPSVPADRVTGANPVATGATPPNIPVNGGSGPFENGRGSSAAPPSVSRAASILYAVAAGTLLMLLH